MNNDDYDSFVFVGTILFIVCIFLIIIIVPLILFFSNSCKKCGSTNQVNSYKVCKTCLNHNKHLCQKCNIRMPNLGYPWCSSCYALEVNCKRCGERPPNPGYKWCQICFNTERSRQASVPSAPGIGDKKCYGCNRIRCVDSNSATGDLMNFCGLTCATNTYSKYGVIELRNVHKDYEFVVKNFTQSWAEMKGPCPLVVAVFLIHSSRTSQRFEEYRDNLEDNKYEFYYHGTKLECDLLNNKSLCKNTGCSTCQIAWDGFDLNFVGSNVPFTRYGNALYFAPNSSKCHDYTQGNPYYGYRCLMFVRIAPGHKYYVTDNMTDLNSPPSGYDSVYGQASAYGALNYDELCIYDKAACMPQYLIIYYHDGSYRIVN